MAPENPPPEKSVERRGSEPRCIICGSVAVSIIPIDPDIQPWGACEAHQTQVDTAYIILMTSPIEDAQNEYDKYIAACKRGTKKPNILENNNIYNLLTQIFWGKGKRKQYCK